MCKDEENIGFLQHFFHLVFNKERMTNWIFYRDLEVVLVITAVQLSVFCEKCNHQLFICSPVHKHLKRRRILLSTLEEMQITVFTQSFDHIFPRLC